IGDEIARPFRDGTRLPPRLNAPVVELRRRHQCGLLRVREVHQSSSPRSDRDSEPSASSKLLASMTFKVAKSVWCSPGDEIPSRICTGMWVPVSSSGI